MTEPGFAQGRAPMVPSPRGTKLIPISFLHPDFLRGRAYQQPAPKGGSVGKRFSKSMGSNKTYTARKEQDVGSGCIRLPAKILFERQHAVPGR